MRYDKYVRATAAVSLGLLALSAFLSHSVLGFMFRLLAGATETGLEKDIISPGALFLISGLIGLLTTVVSFRPLFGWIKERGFPGLVEAPDPYGDEGGRKHIRIALSVSEQGGIWNEVYSQWVPAHHIRDLIKGTIGKNLVLANSEGFRLSIVRSAANAEEGAGEILIVKLKKGRKVLYNLELTPGTRGTLENDPERDFATCWYRLSFVGCDGMQSGGWLKFGGRRRLMNLTFQG